MTNAIFGFPRQTPYFTGMAGGSWLLPFYSTNLLTLPLSKVARSNGTSLANTQFYVTASPARTATMVALARHNFTAAAQIKLTTWADSGRTTVTFAGSFENVWPAGYTPPASTLESQNAIWTWFKRFSTTPITVGALQLEISDASNPAGYVQAGFVEICQHFETRWNFEWGYQFGFNWRSQVTEAIGGVQYIDRRAKPRIARGNFPLVTRDQSMTRFFEMQRQLDLADPILFVPLYDEPAHYPRTAMLAQQMDPGPSVMKMRGGNPVGLIDAVPFALREIIG